MTIKQKMSVFLLFFWCHLFDKTKIVLSLSCSSSYECSPNVTISTTDDEDIYCDGLMSCAQARLIEIGQDGTEPSIAMEHFRVLIQTK